MKQLVFTGDCLATMAQIPDNFIDLTVTSPPYDKLRKYNGYKFNFEAIATELYRITKKGGVVVWVVADGTKKGTESGTSFKQALFFKSIGFNLHDTMIYQKDNPPPVGGHNRYYQAFEYMFVLSKGAPKTFNPIKTERRNKWNDKRTHRVKGFVRDKKGEFKKRLVSLTGKVKVQNIFKYVLGGGNSAPYGVKHPATFPEKLAEDQILSWSNIGDIVFDPMCGSGTTLKMATLNLRHCIGGDTSKAYTTETLTKIRSI